MGDSIFYGKEFDDEMSLTSEFRAAIGKEIDSLGVDMPDVSQLAGELRMELVSQINGSDMPDDVKNVLTNSISVVVMGKNHAVISISAIRPSIYSDVIDAASKYGVYDLALVYDRRPRIKSSAIYYNTSKPRDAGGFIPIGRVEGFARAYNTDYLQKTANSFMAKNPNCAVTVSRQF